MKPVWTEKYARRRRAREQGQERSTFRSFPTVSGRPKRVGYHLHLPFHLSCPSRLSFDRSSFCLLPPSIKPYIAVRDRISPRRSPPRPAINIYGQQRYLRRCQCSDEPRRAHFCERATREHVKCERGGWLRSLATVKKEVDSSRSDWWNVSRNRKFIYALMLSPPDNPIFESSFMINEILWYHFQIIAQEWVDEKNSEQETGIIYKLHFSYSDFVLKLDPADYGLDPFTLAPNLYLNCNVNCAISLTWD